MIRHQAAAPDLSRAEAVETVARHLLPRASLLTRLLLRGHPVLSRAEAGILSSLAQGSRRITELAASEALAQPTVTQLVDRLEQRGQVLRGRQPGDGRVVLVSLTEAGRAALDALRADYRALLRDELSDRPDEDLRALAAATEVLQDVIDALQRDERP